MLRYLNAGARELGDCPMPAHKRVNWEFLAVVSGKLAPMLEAPAEQLPLRSNTLWLFPPGYSHGWVGAPGEACELVIVHFNSVPLTLERVVAERGFLSCSLSVTDKKRLLGLSRGLKRHYWHPVFTSEMHEEKALIEIGLILLRGQKIKDHSELAGVSLTRVLEAEAYLRDRLSGRPSISSAAKSIGISPSQLRRLFKKVRKTNPKRILNRLRFESAMRRMAESDEKLSRIADECGFSSDANFCRAFKAFNGKSPNVWRREIYIQYKRPSGTAKSDFSRHGRRYREL
jgi:AraC-like DNA-binding protein